MRPIALMLLALFSTISAAEDAAAKLPAALQTELADYDSDVGKIQAKADAEKAKRAGELAKVLAKAQTDATKKGDLETALAIKAKIDALPIDRLDDLGNRVPAAQQGAVDVEALASAIKKGELTEAQWNAIKAPEITCDAKGKMDLKTTLTKSQRCLVVPNPADRWQGEPGSPKFGYAGQAGSNGDGWAYYSMIVRVSEDDANAHPLVGEPILSGPGKVYAWLFWNGSPNHVGSIRVKVIPVR